MSTTQSIHDETGSELLVNPANGRRVARMQLLKKEARQVAPLLAALAGCDVVLHLISLFQRGNQENFHVSILPLIPVLFAVGVGPLLVSQEKEQRTLHWMASLPIRPKSMVLSKLIVSVLGLIVIWMISLATTFVFYPQIFATASSNLETLFWPANTFFMLVMGFAAAWVLPTAGSTLVTLLFSAIAAGVLAGLAHEFFYSGHRTSAFMGCLLFFNAVATSILGFAAIRWGIRSFIAEAKSEAAVGRSRRSELSKLAVDRTQSLPLAPASGLIWQILRQNRMLWVGLVFLLWMGLVSLAYETQVLKSPDVLGYTAIVGGVLLSWLGASVFGSDARHGRIRFLADRGVSPFKIWWTRLALPSVCLVLCGLVYFWVMKRCEHLSGHSQVDFELFGFLMIGVAMAFGLSQWLSQWSKSTLIAFCIAPVLTIFSFMYVVFLHEYINSPWWLLVGSIGISFAATRIMLRPWMDGRTGLRYWLTQGALLTGVLALPLVPFLFTYATYPGMPTAMRQELTEEAKRYEPFDQGIELVLPTSEQEESDSETKDEFIGFGESASASVVALDRQLMSIPGPMIYSRAGQPVVKEAQLMSLRMDTDGDAPTERQQQYRDRYRRSLILLNKFVIHMRMSDQLFDQEFSDRIERWLVEELIKTNRKELFSEEEYSAIVKSLADRATRHQARRRAIVVAWKQVRDGHSDFGGVSLPVVSAESMAASWLVAERNAGKAAAVLLDYLESKDPDLTRFPAEIQAFWPAGVAETEGRFGESNWSSVRLPSALWHQDWEDKAVELSKSLK